MSRIILLIGMLVLFTNCGNKSLFYEGYVYHDGKPQDQVKIRKAHTNSGEYCQTDSTGFFQLKKEANSVHSLIFEKEGFVTDTVPTVWSQHGEKVQYRFMNNRKDTLYLKVSN